MGRPTKLSPEVQAVIVREIELGVDLDDAAAAAGVWYNTLNEWRKKGAEQKTGKYHEFNVAVARAEGIAAENFTKTITNAAQKGDWKAALEWLKRRRRAKWGDAVDVTTGGEKLKGYILVSPDDWDKEKPTE
jgi:hypothetical protein